jgi:hypothetical protein
VVLAQESEAPTTSLAEPEFIIPTLVPTQRCEVTPPTQPEVIDLTQED